MLKIVNQVIQHSQVNFSTPGSLAPVDHWHNDSIAYAGVVVISDMEGMKGGELELFRGEKGEGKRLLREGGLEPGMVETVNYESPGKMILTHGSEVSSLLYLYPVTRVWCSGPPPRDPRDL